MSWIPFVDPPSHQIPEKRRVADYILAFCYVGVIVLVTVFAVLSVLETQYEPVVEDGLDNRCSQGQGGPRDSSVAVFCDTYLSGLCSSPDGGNIECGKDSCADDANGKAVCTGVREKSLTTKLLQAIGLVGGYIGLCILLLTIFRQNILVRIGVIDSPEDQ